MRLAGLMEEWFIKDAADGFIMLSPCFPGPREEFVNGVVPELQRRALFRTEHEGKSPRENLDFRFRPNRHVAG